jgi:hypothetical protein
MLVPRAEAGLALGLSVHLGGRQAARTREKLGLSDEDLAHLCTQIHAVLMAAPGTSAEVRKRLPEGAIRSFGAAGKKFGVSSSLPMALRYLESKGHVCGRPQEGLDGQRYLWTLEDDPVHVETDLLTMVGAVARRYWAHAGPASVNDFAAWSGLGKRVCKTGVADLGLKTLNVAGTSDALLALLA